MQKRGFICAACAALALSCQQPSNITNITNIIAGNPTEENLNFETRGIPLISGSDYDFKQSVYIRIYDGNEYLPYIGLRHWLGVNEFDVKDMSYSDGVYTILIAGNRTVFSLVVNTKSGTIYSPAWVGFNNPDPTVWIEKAKLLKSVKVFTGQRSVTFDLGKYGFKIYGGSEDVYLPFCAANELFACIQNYTCLYNGVALYEFNGQTTDYKTFKESSWYSDINQRPESLIDITYRMFCFTHDYFYGRPGYYGFADDGTGHATASTVNAADALSFDDFLTLYDPQTKQYLNAQDYPNYIRGLNRLTQYAYGDGHSYLEYSDDSFLFLDSPEIRNAHRDEADIIPNSKKNEGLEKRLDLTISGSVNSCRLRANIIDSNKAILSGKDVELIDGGKTVVVRFDEFTFDYSKWNAYYESDECTAEPDPSIDGFPEDTIGLFYRVFYKILHDPAYQNVTTILIDESANGGGLVNVLKYLLCLFTGYGDIYYEDVHSGTHYHEYVTADLNLDGTVDSYDETYRQKFFGERSNSAGHVCRGLNVAILTSGYSFSCGNAFSYYAKERGIKIIGERSGGGSCLVGKGVSADGYPYNFSVNMRLMNQTFSESLESGAEVDLQIQCGTLSSMDYSSFYNNTVLSEKLSELFGSNY